MQVTGQDTIQIELNCHVERRVVGGEGGHRTHLPSWKRNVMTSACGNLIFTPYLAGQGRHAHC